MTTFVRLIDIAAEDKPAALRQAIRDLHAGDVSSAVVFECKPDQFSEIPRSPFAYWVEPNIREMFRRHPQFESGFRTALGGLKTLSDARFVRLWWEIKEESSTLWPPLAKGGEFSLFYADVHLCVNWKSSGEEISYYGYQRRPREGYGATNRGTESYFRPGLTWARRTQSGLGVRAMPSGCIFADKGPAAFIEGDAPAYLLALLAVTTSTMYRYLVELQMAFGSYEVGVIQRTPVPDLSGSERDALADCAQRAWFLRRKLDTVDETSHAFVLPFVVNERVTLLCPESARNKIAQAQQQIDDLVFSRYSVYGEQRMIIRASFERNLASTVIQEADSDADQSEVDYRGRTEDPAAQTLSWLVGVAFGRFDPRLATDERPIPPEPKPFDPLPKRSPGMWPEGEGPPVAPPDILVDDPGHARDLAMHVSDVAATVDVSEPDDLRAWLAHEFFPLHVKMYSKSRRRAPIYWQLATSSVSYSVWLYIHAFTRDTLFRVQNDYVAPKLEHEQRRLETMLSEFGERATAAERRAVAAQEVFVGELRDFLDEVKRVAPLWNPNLDDGVSINFAPVWRLVPQHKPWQRELKATWDALCEGKYDWTHLAMHLWPERVVPKCAMDRSLAIAHDLEEVFWEQGANGKWSERLTSTVPVDELARGRTSAAIKSALQNLLNAPIVNGRGRRRRGAAGTGNGGGR